MARGQRGSNTVHRTSQFWRRGGWRYVSLKFEGTAGGQYIDVYFDGKETALEVINIFDYEKGESRLKFGDKMDPLVDAWLDQKDKDEIAENPESALRRDWLRNYADNNRD